MTEVEVLKRELEVTEDTLKAERRRAQRLYDRIEWLDAKVNSWEAVHGDRGHQCNAKRILQAIRDKLREDG